jgi:hypothetical protein
VLGQRHRHHYPFVTRDLHVNHFARLFGEFQRPIRRPRGSHHRMGNNVRRWPDNRHTRENPGITLVIVGGSSPSVLQQATVKVTTNAQCKTSYSTLATSMLCAAAPGKDTCQVTETWQATQSQRNQLNGVFCRETAAVHFSSDPHQDHRGLRLESSALVEVRHQNNY